MDLISGRADPLQILIISMIIGGRSAGRSRIRSCLVLRQRHNDIWGEFGLDPTIAYLYNTVSGKICQLIKISKVQWRKHRPGNASREYSNLISRLIYAIHYTMFIRRKFYCSFSISVVSQTLGFKSNI